MSLDGSTAHRGPGPARPRSAAEPRGPQGADRSNSPRGRETVAALGRVRINSRRAPRPCHHGGGTIGPPNASPDQPRHCRSVGRREDERSAEQIAVGNSFRSSCEEAHVSCKPSVTPVRKEAHRAFPDHKSIAEFPARRATTCSGSRCSFSRASRLTVAITGRPTAIPCCGETHLAAAKATVDAGGHTWSHLDAERPHAQHLALARAVVQRVARRATGARGLAQRAAGSQGR